MTSILPELYLSLLSGQIYGQMNQNNNIELEIQQGADTAGNHGTYGSSLLDPRWKARRAVILNRDRNRCINCGSGDDLQVHHRQYHFSKSLNEFILPWDYDERYLITLCEKCHQKGHRSYKVPVKMVN